VSSVISSNSKRPKKVTISYPYIQFALNGTQADSLRAFWIAGWAMPLAAEAKSQGKGCFPSRKVSVSLLQEGVSLWGGLVEPSRAHKLFLGIAEYPFGVLSLSGGRWGVLADQEQPVLRPLRDGYQPKEGFNLWGGARRALASKKLHSTIGGNTPVGF
jgi:hypothetical protein